MRDWEEPAHDAEVAALSVRTPRDMTYTQKLRANKIRLFAR